MARISTYNIDQNVTAQDKFIGTDSSGGVTKNFTFEGVTNFLNNTSAIAIAGQNNFFFQTDLSHGRNPGTISFASGGGVNTAFNSLTTIRFSRFASSGNNVLDYLQTLVDKNVILVQIDDVNNFGVYKLLSLDPVEFEPDFYDATFEVQENHGALLFDKFYAFAIYSGAATAIQDLQSVTDIGNTTTNSITADAYSVKPTYTSNIVANLGYTGDGTNAAGQLSLRSLSTGAGNWGVINPGSLTDIRSYVLPDQSGTIALLSDIPTVVTPSLQDVTNVGNATTNAIAVQIGDEYTNVRISEVYTANDITGSYAFIENAGIIGVNGGAFEGTIKATNLTVNNVNLEFPQKAAGSYTIATTSDLPTQYLTSAIIDSNIGDRLKPLDVNSNGFYFNRSFNGSVGYTALNTNTGNAAVVSHGVGIDTNSYIKNIFTAKFGPNYFVPLLAGKGGLLGTEEVFVGSTDNNDVSILTGVDFSSISRKFTVKADGQLVIQTTPTAGTTSDFLLLRDTSGNVKQIVYPIVPTKTSDLINDGDNGTSHFISLEDLPSTLTVYPTTVASGIGGYNRLVSSITDPDYNTTAVDVSTGAITGTAQLIAGLITDENQIIGNPGIFNMTTLGNIRKTSGSGQAEFFFRVYKRDSGGTETLILQSNNTQQITSSIYAEFFTNGLWNDGIFVSTDRIVIKFYGTKVGSGTSPTYDFQFGGSNPVRSVIPVPLNVIPSGGSPLSREEFTYSGSQDFTLSATPSYIYLVTVNGQGLKNTQYSFIGTTLTIANTLQTVNGQADEILVIYAETSPGVLEYYTKAQVDAFLTNANIESIIGQASSSNSGYLSSTDWSTFNAKQDAITVTTNNYSGVATFAGNTLNIPNYDGFIPKLRGHETYRGVSYSNNSTTEVTSGGITMATTGSTIARSVDATNYAFKQIRKGFYGSVVSAGRYTGTRGSALLFYLGGGFKYVCDVYIADTAYGSGCRQFYGMMGQTTDLTYSDSILVDTMLNVIGIGSDALDTNLQVFHNDGAGVCTKIDLGVNFPANRTAGAALTTVYSIEIYSETDASSVKYCVRNKETGGIAMGTITNNLPLNTQGLNFTASRCMGAGITNTGRFDLLTLGVYSL